MTLLELTVTKDALKNQLRQYESIQANCESCLNFDASKELCMHFAAAPPPEWRIGQVACEYWLFDNVPF